MPDLHSLALKFIEFYFMDLFKFIFLYLVACVVVALPVAIKKRKPKDISVQKFFWFCFPKELYFTKAIIQDVAICLMGPFLTFSAGITLISNPYVHQTMKTAMEHVMPYGALGTNNWMIQTGVLVIGLITLDLIKYINHYCMHNVPFLWEIHKPHHTSKTLTIFSTTRAHPFQDLFIVMPLSILSLGIIDGVYEHAIAGASEQRTLLYSIFYGTLMLYNSLKHSHHWINFSPFWSQIFVSPAQHFIHHSKVAEVYNKNYGAIFSVWDRIFGTLYVPENSEKGKIDYGLDEESTQQYKSLGAFYLRPFINIYKLAFNPVRSNS